MPQLFSRLCSHCVPGLLAVACVAVLSGCSSAREIRIQNVSTVDYTDVTLAGQPYGDIAPGEMSEYKNVTLKFRYAALKMRADGRYVTGQTLNYGAKRFTYRIGVKNLADRHLAIEIVRD